MSKSMEAYLGGVSEEGGCRQQEVCGLRVYTCVLAAGQPLGGGGERHARGFSMCAGGLGA